MNNPHNMAASPSFTVCPLLDGKNVVETIKSDVFDPLFHPILRHAKPLHLPLGTDTTRRLGRPSSSELQQYREEHINLLHAWGAIVIAGQAQIRETADDLIVVLKERLAEIQRCQTREEFDALMAAYQLDNDPFAIPELQAQWLLNQAIETHINLPHKTYESAKSCLQLLRESRAFFDDHKILPLLKFTERSTRVSGADQRWPWPQRHANALLHALQLFTHVLVALEKTCAFDISLLVESCTDQCKAISDSLQVFSVTFEKTRTAAREHLVHTIANTTGDKRLAAVMRRSLPTKEAAMTALQHFVLQHIVAPALEKAIAESGDQSLAIQHEDMIDWSNPVFEPASEAEANEWRQLNCSPSLGVVCLMDALDHFIEQHHPALVAMNARYSFCTADDISEHVVDDLGEMRVVGFRVHTPVYMSELLIDHDDYRVGVSIDAGV